MKKNSNTVCAATLYYLIEWEDKDKIQKVVCGERYMTKKIDAMTSWVETNKDFLKICFVSVLFWGIAAHGFMFMHWNLSHDSLWQFYSADGSWRYSLGRIFVTFYAWLFRRSLTIPWLVGIYALTWLFLTVIAVCSIFSIKSKRNIFLVAGALVTNECVIALTGTYLSDLDCDMFALLLATTAVICWKRDKGKGSLLFSAVLLSLSLGFYQSYLSVAVTLVLMVLILELFNKKNETQVIYSGLRALVMFVCSGLLYVFWLKCAQMITGVSLVEDSYNSLTSPLHSSFSGILRNTVLGWANTIYSFIRTPSLYGKWISSALNLTVFLFCVLLFALCLHSYELNRKQKLLGCVLFLLIPIGMDVSFVLAGFSHDLMHYAYCFFQVFLLLLLVFWKPVQQNVSDSGTSKKSIILFIAYISVSLSLLGNVITSNAFYVKKDLEAKATLSLFTRIADRIESMDGYEPGETPVVFVGHPDNLLDPIPGFENLYRITGGGIRSASNIYYMEYFEYILQRPINVLDADDNIQKQEAVLSMPAFPDQGCVQWFDGKLIVKLAN